MDAARRVERTTLAAGRAGKHGRMVEAVRFALATGRRVVVAASDQGATVRFLAAEFPGCLFTLVGDFGVRVHLR